MQKKQRKGDPKNKTSPDDNATSSLEALPMSKALSLFGDCTCGPVASQLWAIANKPAVDAKVKKHCTSRKKWISIWKKVVAELYGVLDRNSKKIWKKKAHEVKQQLEDHGRVYK